MRGTVSGIRSSRIQTAMSYVSSAGLRVLLIMFKTLKDKEHFKMTGINDDVRDILKTTGFDTIFF